MEMLTISSNDNIEEEDEDHLPGLFPENEPRPKKFYKKNTIIVSSRVHPGESGASFMFNGLLDLLMDSKNP